MSRQKATGIAGVLDSSQIVFSGKLQIPAKIHSYSRCKAADFFTLVRDPDVFFF